MHDIVVRPFVFDFDSAAVAAGRSSDAVDQLNSERPRTSLASPMSRGFGPAMKGKVFTIVPSLRRGLPTESAHNTNESAGQKAYRNPKTMRRLPPSVAH